MTERLHGENTEPWGLRAHIDQMIGSQPLSGEVSPVVPSIVDEKTGEKVIDLETIELRRAGMIPDVQAEQNPLGEGLILEQTDLQSQIVVEQPGQAPTGL